jgi:thymidine phosphorylase
VADDPGRLPRAKLRRIVRSPATGYVQQIDAFAIGMAAARLGAGRTQVTDRVNPAVGLWLRKKTGEVVRKGEALADLLAHSHSDARPAADLVVGAYRIGRARPPRERIILGRLYNRFARRE